MVSLLPAGHLMPSSVAPTPSFTEFMHPEQRRWTAYPTLKIEQAQTTPAALWQGALVHRQAQVNPENGNDNDTLPTRVSEIQGQPSPTFVNAPHDSALALMPDFVFSMPAQIVVNGLNLAMMAVLAIHLAFTTRYHFPLSKLNYLLQAGSTSLLLLSLIIELHVILSELHRKSHRWPYMFPYIGVEVPPPDNSWTMTQMVFYLLMEALTTLLAHLVHIQFLTLLFPSALEKRLILWMLGPLALIASGMQFTDLSAESDYKTSDLGDAIRNICNSTLTLLYMSALFIWGFLVNRRRAWRTDGGTALFGGGAVGLALLNTVISFVEIKYDRLWWLPDIGWTLTIWQSWLGFWWWVGSGMGIGEVEDRAEREAKRRKRIERRKRRLEKEAAAKARAEAAAEKGDSETRLNGGIRMLKNAMSRVGDQEDGGISGSINRRLRRRHAAANENIELTEVSTHNGDLSSPTEGDGRDGEEVALEAVSVAHPEDAQTTQESQDSDPTAASSAPPGPIARLFQKFAENQPSFIRQRFQRLRIAHAAAARRAASQQTALRDQVLQKNQGARDAGAGLRPMRLEGHGSTNSPSFDASSSRAAHRADDSHRGSSTAIRDPRTSAQLRSDESSKDDANDPDWEDQREDGAAVAEGHEDAESTMSISGNDTETHSPSRSWFWRGGLTRARLRDRTEYD